MIAVFTVILLLIAAAGCFVGANFCAPGGAAQQGLVYIAGALSASVLPAVPALVQSKIGSATAQPRSPQTGHARLHSMCAFGLVGLATIFAVMFSTSTTGCRVSPSVFYQATVDCAKVNPERTATSAAVLTCLGEAIAGNAIACIAQLPQTLHWTIDEASCVIADLAQKENTKVGAGTATSRDLDIRNEAVKFMTDNHIRIANTYAGAP